MSATMNHNQANTNTAAFPRTPKAHQRAGGKGKKRTFAKRDVYQEVTDKMIQALEAGTPPWTTGSRHFRDLL